MKKEQFIAYTLLRYLEIFTFLDEKVTKSTTYFNRDGYLKHLIAFNDGKPKLALAFGFNDYSGRIEIEIVDSENILV